MTDSLNIGDWVVANHGLVGQVWLMFPMYCQINSFDSEGYKAPALIPTEYLTKITKEVADIMRDV